MPSLIQLKFKRKEEIATGTNAFHFEKPPGFEFIAGQYLNWRLIDPPEDDDEGPRRFFSIAAAPHEPELMLATRMRDTAFKRTINNFKEGDLINAFGPNGHLILHEDSNIPAVFLTGGIGVTPFRSMTLQATYDNLPHKIYMFYSNRTLGDAPFLNDLETAQKQNPNFKLVNTLTEMEKLPAGWTGETGFINKQMLEKYLGDISKPIYYVAGPPQMVEAMLKMLKEAGLPDEQINSENFTGY